MEPDRRAGTTFRHGRAAPPHPAQHVQANERVSPLKAEAARLPLRLPRLPARLPHAVPRADPLRRAALPDGRALAAPAQTRAGMGRALDAGDGAHDGAARPPDGASGPLERGLDAPGVPLPHVQPHGAEPAYEHASRHSDTNEALAQPNPARPGRAPDERPAVPLARTPGVQGEHRSGELGLPVLLSDPAQPITPQPFPGGT